MIAKRIRTGSRQERGAFAQLSRSVHVLSRYILDAQLEQSEEKLIRLRDYIVDAHADLAIGEKVEFAGSVNLISEDTESWEAQMLAAAMQCTRGRDPVEHFILSWPEDEKPNEDQCRDAVSITLEALGYHNCPVIWAVHGNTANMHIHLEVVRYDLISGRMAGSGWDIDRLHQAVALIEERQGWKREKNALYYAKDGVVHDAQTHAIVRDAVGNQTSRSARKSRPSDDGLDQLVSQLDGLLARATCWADWHRELSILQIQYDRKGSGAVISVGGRTWKASQIDRSLTLPALQKRFGFFVADKSRTPDGFTQYQDACREELARIREAHKSALDILNQGRIRDHASVQSVEAPHLRMVRAAIDAEHSSARKAIDTAFREAKAEFANRRLSIELWRQAGEPEHAPRARMPMVFFPSVVSAPSTSANLGDGQFASNRHAWATEYRSADRKLAFVDHRSVIIVHQPHLPTVAAALELAAKRWGGVRVTGTPEFVAACVEVATARGIALFDAYNKPLVPISSSRQNEQSIDKSGGFRDRETPKDAESAANAQKLLVDPERTRNIHRRGPMQQVGSPAATSDGGGKPMPSAEPQGPETKTQQSLHNSRRTKVEIDVAIGRTKTQRIPRRPQGLRAPPTMAGLRLLSSFLLDCRPKETEGELRSAGGDGVRRGPSQHQPMRNVPGGQLIGEGADARTAQSVVSPESQPDFARTDEQVAMPTGTEDKGATHSQDDDELPAWLRPEHLKPGRGR